MDKSLVFLILFGLSRALTIPDVNGQVVVKPGTNITIGTQSSLILKNTDLYLQSDYTGDASLIDYNPVIYRNGSQAHVGRFLFSNQWHIIASPVTDARAEMFTNDYLMQHDESTNLWTDIVSVNTPLQPGQGYALWSIDGAATVESFVGSTNTGNVSFLFTNYGSQYNVTGNPYPSVIDWDLVTIPPTMQAAFWVLDPEGGSYGTWKYYIPGGGAANTASRYIASGQGFGVKANGSGGVLTFSNQCRTHQPSDFLKATTARSMLVVGASGQGTTLQTAIRFMDEATEQKDRLLDVDLLRPSNPLAPVLYTTAGTDTLVINSMPDIALHPVIPIWFEAGQQGEYTLTNLVQDYFEPYRVRIEDVALASTSWFDPGTEYRFNHSGSGSRQFNLHLVDATGVFDDAGTLVTATLVNKQLLINISPEIIGQNPSGIVVSVYNSIGQELLSYRAYEEQSRQMLNTASGIVVVNVTGNGVRKTFKLFNL